MNNLGSEMLNAMRDQGWLVIVVQDTVLAVDPTGVTGHTIPLGWFSIEDDTALRFVLLNAITSSGLQWPWPPDHREGWHGEVPRSGE